MPSLPPETHIGRVGLTVADSDAVATFYADIVGLSRRSEDHGITLGTSERAVLSLEAAPDMPARPRDAAGLFHVAYRVPTRAALGDALTRIREANALSGASDHHVSEALYLSDPEGNGIEVYRDRPRSHWEWTVDDEVRMVTERLDLEALATAGTGGATVPLETDVGHVHLEVINLAASRDFYVDTLGFDLMATYPGALFVAAGGYHHHVGLNTWNRRSSRKHGRGLDFVELVVPTIADRTKVIDRLRAADHPVDVEDDTHRVQDPNGVEIRVRTASQS